MEPTEHDPIVRRLHSLGGQPVDPEVVASHRNLMASVPVASSRSRLRPLMVASMLAGSLLGGVGLAAAGPGEVAESASEVAKAVVATVTLGAVEEPEKSEAEDAEESPAAKAAAQEAKAARKAAKAANSPSGDHGVTRSDDGCLNGFDGSESTHGQYVSSVAKDPDSTEADKQAAAKSNCGKPVNSIKPEAVGGTAKENSGKSDEEHGKPEAGVQNGQSSAEHPGDHPNQKAFDAVGEHRRAGAGHSAGHGPTAPSS